jgi:hypothetical protein
MLGVRSPVAASGARVTEQVACVDEVDRGARPRDEAGAGRGYGGGQRSLAAAGRRDSRDRWSGVDPEFGVGVDDRDLAWLLDRQVASGQIGCRIHGRQATDAAFDLRACSDGYAGSAE